MSSGEPTAAAPRKRRSPREVKAAARMLQKEARRILRRYGQRIAAEPSDGILASVGAIDTLYANRDWPALEDEAERLDELLHHHARFARKSDLRVTIENLLVAGMAALGLRACVYEPFKIPSGSMMPTLQIGDYILVNKFYYGVQIPFTNTVIGDTLRPLERGSVIVFRYPLDESEDYIKRVIGLPGDEVRVSGREVAIKRAGERQFEVLPLRPLNEPCLGEDGQPVTSCQLFEETLDGRTHVVRYMQLGNVSDTRTWKVPAGHIMAMGDNRDQSSDSRAWMISGEAVTAEGLLSPQDLRDLTQDQDFVLGRTDEDISGDDGRHDVVAYSASHRAADQDLVLDIWRDPSLGADAVWTAAVAHLSAPKVTTLAEVLADEAPGVQRDRALAVGAGMDKLAVAADPDHRQAVVLLESAKTVVRLLCGRQQCPEPGDLGLRLADVVGRYHRNHAQDASRLLEAPSTPLYRTLWSGRAAGREHFFERVLRKPGGTGARAEVRLRVFRDPGEGVSVVRDAALLSLGTSALEAERVPELGEGAFVVASPEAYALVLADGGDKMVAVLQCGKLACASTEELKRLGRAIVPGLAEASANRSKMRLVFTAGDVPGWEEVAVEQPNWSAFEHIALEATQRGGAHSAQLEVWMDPDQGLAAAAAARAQLGRLRPDPAIGSHGAWGQSDEGFTIVVGVGDTDTLLELRCHIGLCPTREVAVSLAQRAAGKARDRTNFIDPEAMLPRPFVPRGHVKGRADVIWLPPSRFWTRIR